MNGKSQRYVILFDRVYEKLYGRTYPETQIEFVTFKVRVSEPERPFQIPRARKQQDDRRCPSRDNARHFR